jgi:hypothetical protein
MACELYNPHGCAPSLRKVAAPLAERGFATPNERAYSASAVASMLTTDD